MENPIQAFEHLPKNKKLIAVGGAITLGGILVYMHHKKQQSQDAGASTDTTDGSTSSDGTGASGVQDNGSAAYDQYANDEGILPYQDASDPYGSYYGSGGGGFGTSGGGYSGGVGAGDLNNGTATAMPADITLSEDPALIGALGDIAAGLTGGGAPQTDPTKHMSGRVPTRGKSSGTGGHAVTKRKTTTTPHGTTQHKTNAPSPTNTRKAKTTKARPKAKPKPRRRTVGARMSF